MRPNVHLGGSTPPLLISSSSVEGLYAEGCTKLRRHLPNGLLKSRFFVSPPPSFLFGVATQADDRHSRGGENEQTPASLFPPPLFFPQSGLSRQGDKASRQNPSFLFLPSINLLPSLNRNSGWLVLVRRRQKRSHDVLSGDYTPSVPPPPFLFFS